MFDVYDRQISPNCQCNSAITEVININCKSSQREIKPKCPTSSVELNKLNKLNNYLKNDWMEKVNSNNNYLEGRKVIKLFNINFLAKESLWDIKCILKNYLPNDILDFLLYERRRTQKNERRKERHLNDKTNQKEFENSKLILSQLKNEKILLLKEIESYKLSE